MSNLDSCQSCGMPMAKPEDHGGGNISNLYCKHCTDAQGSLLLRETVRQNMINFYNKTMGRTEEQAAAEVDKIMAKMPAWQSQTQPITPATSTSEPPASPTPEPTTPESTLLPTQPTEPSEPIAEIPSEPTTGASVEPPKPEEEIPTE